MFSKIRGWQKNRLGQDPTNPTGSAGPVHVGLHNSYGSFTQDIVAMAQARDRPDVGRREGSHYENLS